MRSRPDRAAVRGRAGYRGSPLEYGGSKSLHGLAKALDNARILREFKNDDRAAFRAVKSGLRRHGPEAPAIDRALALAALIELSTALDERDGIDDWIQELETIPLTDAERLRVKSEPGGAEHREARPPRA